MGESYRTGGERGVLQPLTFLSVPCVLLLRAGGILLGAASRPSAALAAEARGAPGHPGPGRAPGRQPKGWSSSAAGEPWRQLRGQAHVWRSPRPGQAMEPNPASAQWRRFLRVRLQPPPPVVRPPHSAFSAASPADPRLARLLPTRHPAGIRGAARHPPRPSAGSAQWTAAHVVPRFTTEFNSEEQQLPPRQQPSGGRRRPRGPPRPLLPQRLQLLVQRRGGTRLPALGHGPAAALRGRWGSARRGGTSPGGCRSASPPRRAPAARPGLGGEEVTPPRGFSGCLRPRPLGGGSGTSPRLAGGARCALSLPCRKYLIFFTEWFLFAITLICASQQFIFWRVPRTFIFLFLRMPLASSAPTKVRSEEWVRRSVEVSGFRWNPSVCVRC